MSFRTDREAGLDVLVELKTLLLHQARSLVYFLVRLA